MLTKPHRNDKFFFTKSRKYRHEGLVCSEEVEDNTSLPMCGFIAQLVEHRNGIAEVTGSNPIEALIFSGFFFPIA